VSAQDDIMADAEARAAVDLAKGRSSDLWPAAVARLRTLLVEEAPLVRAAIAARPDDWIAPHHFAWGMVIRNLLRREGFGEQELGVENLDNVYVELIEEAMQ
jgi:hypothetical protein